MTKEELKDFLLKSGFAFERDNKYSCDVYTNDKFLVKSRNTKLVIYVCHNTMRFEWWYEKSKKLVPTFNLNKILPNFAPDFIYDTIKTLQSTYDIKF